MLKVENVSFHYGSRTILSDVSFSVRKGELFGIMGPNGSGKTTLLKLMSGIHLCKSGEVYIKGKPLQDYKQRELAKIVAVLSQHAEESFAYQVKEIVALGRYAHQKAWLHSPTKEDQEAVQEAMKTTGVHHLQNTAIQELSGGEKQRVYLAQALAQEPEILLLDEPTNHLDVSNQKELLDNLKEWSQKNNLTIISIFHDLNLAGLYCDRLLMLHEGIVEIISSPQQVLQEKMIKKVYQTDIKQIPHPKLAAPQIALLPKMEASSKRLIIDERYLKISKNHLEMKVPKPLKTLSSGVTGAGVGWYTNFVNRHVDKNYQCDHYEEEMKSYLRAHHVIPEQTVGMMTAVYIEDAAYKNIGSEDLSVFIVATAGVGNAVDAAQAIEHSSELLPGTINIWIFVNGALSEAAYIQSIMTAAEAKASVLRREQVMDPITGTLATGTSTDSILIAATQEGDPIEFAGTISPLGKLIAAGVTECVTESLKKRNGRLKN